MTHKVGQLNFDKKLKAVKQKKIKKKLPSQSELAELAGCEKTNRVKQNMQEKSSPRKQMRSTARERTTNRPVDTHWRQSSLVAAELSYCLFLQYETYQQIDCNEICR